MPRSKSNVVLVGMPGSGKSTVGPMLAEGLSLGFTDADQLMIRAQSRSPQEILDAEGSGGFRQIEREVLLELDCRNQVIATGGSAVYSRAAMDHLKSNGIIVFLSVRLPALQSRLDNYEVRGIVKKPGQSLAQLLEERSRLYEFHADITVDASERTPRQVAHRIVEKLRES